MEQKIMIVLGLVVLLFAFAFLADFGYIEGFVVKQERKDLYGMPIVQDMAESSFDGTAVVKEGSCMAGCQIQLTNSGGHVIGTDVYLWDLLKCDDFKTLNRFLNTYPFDIQLLSDVCSDVVQVHYAGAAGEGYCFVDGDIVGGRMNFGEEYQPAYAFYECTENGWIDVAHK